MAYKKVDFDKRTLRRQTDFKCPICGKDFHIYNGKLKWTYKVYHNTQYNYMCSYKCMIDFINKYK